MPKDCLCQRQLKNSENSAVRGSRELPRDHRLQKKLEASGTSLKHTREEDVPEPSLGWGALLPIGREP